MSDELSEWEGKMRAWVNQTGDVLEIYAKINALVKEIIGDRPVTTFVRKNEDLSFKIGSTRIGTFSYDKSVAWFWNWVTAKQYKSYGEMHTLADFQRLRPIFAQSIEELLKELAEDDDEEEFTEAAERDIERALVSDLSQLEPGLMLYNGPEGQQYRIGDKILDVLCVDSQERFTIVEIKRGLPNREAIGQAAEYKALVAQHLANGNFGKVRVILLGEQRNPKADKDLVPLPQRSCDF